jgi:hypothetical protein
MEVRAHKSKQELILYLSEEMNMEYGEAKEFYEEEATVIS